jgi:hypothetical protein
MKKWISILVITVAMLSGNSAFSDYYSGNKLLEYCNPNSSKRDICTGYVAGTRGAIDTWKIWENIDSGICVPKEVTLGQSIKVVVKYLEANLDKLHLSASSNVLNAFADAFPCEKTIEMTHSLPEAPHNQITKGDVHDEQD